MFLVSTKPGARKVQNIRSNPAAMLAPGDPAADFGVLLVRGLAEVVDPPTSDLVPTPFFHAYADRMADIGLSRDEFLATYSLAIRIRPTRYLGRAGRRKHAQPLHRPLREQITARGHIHRRKVHAELPETFEVGRVVDPFREVVEGEVAHLAFDPGSVRPTGRSGEPSAATTRAMPPSSMVSPATWVRTGTSHVSSP